MIAGVTGAAVFVAIIAHLSGVPLFADVVSVPISGVVAMCAMGVLGRLLPRVRAHLVRMVPRWIPAPSAVVWITGMLELAGGIGVLVPQTRALAATCLAILLVCVFPANVVDIRRAPTAAEFRSLLIRRGLLQLAFVALCVWIVAVAIQPR